MSDEQAIESGDRSGKLRGKWVTMQTFSTAEEAHLVKLRLDRAGIPGFIDNENTGTTLLPAVGGIALCVPAPFERQAKEVLRSARQSEEEEDEEDEREDPDEIDEGEPYGADEDEDDYGGAARQACPACHSTDVAAFSWLRRVGEAAGVLSLGACLNFIHPLLLLLTLVGAIYLLVTKPGYRCLRCGKRWVLAR